MGRADIGLLWSVSFKLRCIIWQSVRPNFDIYKKRKLTEALWKQMQEWSKFQELVQESGLKENPLSMRDAQAAIATIAEEYNPKHEEVDMPFLQKNGSDGTKGVLAMGDKVVIRQLGKLPATVVEGDSEYLTVQLGALKMKVKASEIITRGSTGASGERSVRTSIQVNLLHAYPFLHICPLLFTRFLPEKML